jgi:hypothetical protein
MSALMDTLRTAYEGDLETAEQQTAGLARAAAGMSRRDPVAAWATYVCGEVLIDRSPERAMQFLDQAIDRAQLVGDRYLLGVTYVSAASLRARHGDPLDAARWYLDVIGHWFAAGDWTHQWTTMRNVVDLFSRVAAYDAAAVLLGALDSRDTSAAAFGAELERLEAARANVTVLLTPDTRAARSQEGASMTDEQVVEFVVGHLQDLSR